jgi:TrmH family RNA methyltransferase
MGVIPRSLPEKTRVILSRRFRMPAREILRSRANPAFRRFQERKRRARGAGLALLEGPKLVREAIGAGLVPREAAFSEQAARSPDGRALLIELEARGAAVRVFSQALLGSLAEVEASQGVVALVEPPRFEESAVFAGTPLVLACAGVQNPGNLGGLLRSAEAAGATGAVLSEGTADPFSWKGLRGSMGSAFRLPLLRGVALDSMLALLKRRGLRTIGADASRGRRYDAVDLRGPVALLVGAEGEGLPEALLAGVDERVAIPLKRPVESLNVGVAAGILLFEAARQRGA